MSTFLARPSGKELDAPGLRTVVRLATNGFVSAFRDPRGIVIATAVIGLVLWGYHGHVEFLGKLWSGWTGPGGDPAGRERILPGIPWDQEWISFWLGAVFVVVVPMLVIKFVLKRRLSEFGLGLPAKGRGRLAVYSGAILVAVALGTFYMYAHDPDMVSLYPFYRGDFGDVGSFLLYEIGYLPFFVAIEFIFRGFLLFGMYVLPDQNSTDPAPEPDADWRLLIPMLAYCTWHLGKPLPELWGSLFWGPASGAIVLATRSIWPVVAAHWLLNVWMDLVIWQGW